MINLRPSSLSHKLHKYSMLQRNPYHPSLDLLSTRISSAHRTRPPAHTQAWTFGSHAAISRQHLSPTMSAPFPPMDCGPKIQTVTVKIQIPRQALRSRRLLLAHPRRLVQAPFQASTRPLTVRTPMPLRRAHSLKAICHETNPCLCSNITTNNCLSAFQACRMSPNLDRRHNRTWPNMVPVSIDT
jgi:hypothetical protein